MLHHPTLDQLQDLRLQGMAGAFVELQGNPEANELAPCRAPAVRGWTVCRFHGAGGGAPKGARNGRYKNGLFTTEAVEERRCLSELLRQSKRALAALSCEGER